MGTELYARDVDAGAIGSGEPVVRRRRVADDGPHRVAGSRSANRACSPIYVSRHHADE